MFIGHFAVAFGAKRAAPEVSLGTWFVAAQLPDMVWPVLLLAGVEKVRIAPGITPVTPFEFVSYPYSHSLLFVSAWASLLVVAYRIMRQTWRPAPWLAAAVVSHWVLDVVSHRPDMPLWPGSPLLGLGLWNSRPATVVVEASMLALGLTLYMRTTRAHGTGGSVGLLALVGFLVTAYLAALFGPPPPSVQAVAWSGILGFLIFFAADWVDRRRVLHT